MYIPVILALRRWRQEDLKFEALLGYIVKSCPEKKRRRRKREDNLKG